MFGVILPRYAMENRTCALKICCSDCVSIQDLKDDLVHYNKARV